MFNLKRRSKLSTTLLALIVGASVLMAGQVWAEVLPPIRDASESNGKIYVIAKISSGSFWAQTKIASDDISGSGLIGGAEVIYFAPPLSTDIAGQINATETAVQANALALVVGALDMDALVPLTEKAYDMGIPVITYDSMIRSKKYDYHLATNSFAVSQALGRAFSEKMGGKGKYAVLSGSAGAAVEEERKDGFIAGLGPGWEITAGGVQYNNYDWNKSLGQAQDILTANPDLKGWFTTFCVMCNHTAIAMKEAGFKPGQLGNASFDMNADSYFNTKDGWVTASAVQDPYNMTQAAIKMAYFLATSTVKRKPPASMDTNYEVVTPENIMSPRIQTFLSVVKKIDKIND
jgi:ABC-type sugar transport system substrate-binding protein